MKTQTYPSLIKKLGNAAEHSQASFYELSHNLGDPKLGFPNAVQT